MTPGELEVDPDLAARAEQVADAQGETLEQLVERLLRAYLDPPNS